MSLTKIPGGGPKKVVTISNTPKIQKELMILMNKIKTKLPKKGNNIKSKEFKGKDGKSKIQLNISARNGKEYVIKVIDPKNTLGNKQGSSVTYYFRLRIASKGARQMLETTTYNNAIQMNRGYEGVDRNILGKIARLLENM